MTKPRQKVDKIKINKRKTKEQTNTRKKVEK